MTAHDHVANGLLVQAIDDELSGSENAIVEVHLLDCGKCKRRYHELRSASVRFESALTAFIPAYSEAERETLVWKMQAREQKSESGKSVRSIRQFSWGIALAAMIAIAAILIPQLWQEAEIGQQIPPQVHASAAFEVDGERFIALPYSNPELPMTAPHIVQMQVPVSSLAAAGIVFEPISNQVSSPDRSVLADVLLGTDGRPLGVHLLTME